MTQAAYAPSALLHITRLQRELATLIMIRNVFLQPAPQSWHIMHKTLPPFNLFMRQSG